MTVPGEAEKMESDLAVAAARIAVTDLTTQPVRVDLIVATTVVATTIATTTTMLSQISATSS